jgi:tRNA (adenine37-N6)-methyltransferase
VAKSAGPPASHRDPPQADHDPDALPAWTFRPIGVVRSPYRYVHDAPRQPAEGTAPEARIVLRRGMQNCLADLAGFERIWVLFVFNYARGWREQVRPPRDVKKRGVYATRSPHRPNPLGLSAVRVKSVRARTIVVLGHDFLDGTPVLDLKPYVPYCDAHPLSRAGWTDALPDEAPDHRWK